MGLGDLWDKISPFQEVEAGLSWKGVGEFLSEGPWDLPGKARRGIWKFFKSDDDDKKPTGDRPRMGDTPHQPTAPNSRPRWANQAKKQDDWAQWFADNGPLLIGGSAVGLLLIAFIFKALRH